MTKEIPATRHLADRRTLVQGLAFGTVFGFLLEKGDVANYDVIIGQLLLTDFTVLKVMLSAVVTGMIGIYAMKHMGWIELHLKSGSAGKNVVGGLIFGVGFAVLGFCPGTIAAAIGNGHLDALVGGLTGILIGCGLFAAVYPQLDRTILRRGEFGDLTLPRLLKVPDWAVVVPMVVLIGSLLSWLERSGW